MICKNFSFKEIFAHCTKAEIIDALSNKEIMNNIIQLLHVLEDVRAFADCAIYVNSGYRDDAHNKRVGGVSTSQHLKGQAADIQTPCNMSKIYEAVIRCIALDEANASNPDFAYLEHTIGQFIMYVPKCYENKGYTAANLAQFAKWYHIALPNEKYKSFTPSIKFV